MKCRDSVWEAGAVSWRGAVATGKSGTFPGAAHGIRHILDFSGIVVPLKGVMREDNNKGPPAFQSATPDIPEQTH